MIRYFVLLAFLAIGCGDTEEGPSDPPPVQDGYWVNPFDWSDADPDLDPFADRRPESWSCPPEAYRAEELAGVWVYSVETQNCDWLTLTQPTLLPLAAGDRVQMNVWHFQLIAPEPATALIGLATEAGVLVEVEEPIPSPSRMVQLSFTATDPIPAGTDLYFHLNNHGANSWHLVEVLLNPPTDE